MKSIEKVRRKNIEQEKRSQFIAKMLCQILTTYWLTYYFFLLRFLLYFFANAFSFVQLQNINNNLKRFQFIGNNFIKLLKIPLFATRLPILCVPVSVYVVLLFKIHDILFWTELFSIKKKRKWEYNVYTVCVYIYKSVLFLYCYCMRIYLK